jgi:hypothetical protein
MIIPSFFESEAQGALAMEKYEEPACEDFVYIFPT